MSSLDELNARTDEYDGDCCKRNKGEKSDGAGIEQCSFGPMDVEDDKSGARGAVTHDFRHILEMRGMQGGPSMNSKS